MHYEDQVLWSHIPFRLSSLIINNIQDKPYSILTYQQGEKKICFQRVIKLLNRDAVKMTSPFDYILLLLSLAEFHLSITKKRTASLDQFIHAFLLMSLNKTSYETRAKIETLFSPIAIRSQLKKCDMMYSESVYSLYHMNLIKTVLFSIHDKLHKSPIYWNCIHDKCDMITAEDKQYFNFFQGMNLLILKDRHSKRAA